MAAGGGKAGVLPPGAFVPRLVYHTTTDRTVNATLAAVDVRARRGVVSRAAGVRPKWICAIVDKIEGREHLRRQVRKTPSWPRSWANFSLF
jgi:hypothetical protein